MDFPPSAIVVAAGLIIGAAILALALVVATRPRPTHKKITREMVPPPKPPPVKAVVRTQAVKLTPREIRLKQLQAADRTFDEVARRRFRDWQTLQRYRERQDAFLENMEEPDDG